MVTLLTQLIHTHDTEINWNKCTKFVPKKCDLIVYDIDDTHPYPRFKIGDGTTTIVNLPFTVEVTMEQLLNVKDGVGYLDAGRIAD